ncbi:MAG: sugar phosphate nucleotidyltransferase [Elainella sp. Prado103]|jgi:glucose-1-phosphate thymidylyltransferase|nr:sugar phosphate nucleotidyltransferase [Elainella sp. Prado103]
MSDVSRCDRSTPSAEIDLPILTADSIDSLEVIALLPAGGQATRLSPLPMSKELYPIGFHPEQRCEQIANPDLSGQSRSETALKPKVVAHYLLEKMRLAGITKAIWVLRPGKWDIPAYFGDGTMLNMHFAYMTVHVPYGVPYTLDQAYPFVQRSIVALGFPDILFEPAAAYQQVLNRLRQRQADVVLGLFPTQQTWKAGMVSIDSSGRVQQIIEKPQQSDLKYMWAIAVWTPRFTQFLHEFLQQHQPTTELPIGDVIQAGIAAGLDVQAECFPEGRYLDVGTPDDLRQAIRSLT